MSSSAAAEASTSRGYMIPILVAGEPQVGKTTVAKGFITGSLPSHTSTTYGTDLLFKSVNIDNHKTYIQIWEGVVLENMDFDQEGRFFPRNVSATLMIYSHSTQGSMKAVQTWHTIFTSKRAESGQCEMAVLANSLPKKADEAGKGAQESREALDEVHAFCKEMGIQHFVMDCPEDIDTVKRAFEHVVTGGFRCVLAKESC